MVSTNYRYAFFDVNICGNCGFIYVPESYSGLVEYVENHKTYYTKSIRHYLETVHLVMTDGEFDKIVSSNLSDLDSVEQRYKQIGDILREHIHEGYNYLDLGSNYGTCTEFVRRLFPAVHVTGVEINDNFVKSSREHYPQLNIVSGDVCNKAVGKFDFIYCSDVIEHIWDIDAFVGGIISACADNALVLLITPNADSPEARLQGKEWWSFIVPHHAQIFGMRSLNKLMERRGFEHVDSGVIGQELWAVYRLSALGESAGLLQRGTGQLREMQP
jgi:2-polyprenyl-3-methyl-5-hydroxy-6-metoxy-1,4-benzoquinol methylase